ncbi:MAG: septum formation initiator family protein [Oscillospiraceae bacterium]|nr:septum formation initiator family protein [Oscillospiraceae bacterium]
MSLKLRSQKVREVKRNKHGFVRLLAGSAILVTAVYVVVSIISSKISIRNNMEKYNELVAQTNEINEDNERISGYLENESNLDEYIENIARERLDYAKADEKIYYIVPSGE